MKTAAVGYGAGDQNPDEWPNALRVFLQDEFSSEVRRTEPITQIETNLDDLNPQAYEYVMERLFNVGAIDVALTPVVMKKTRPGIVLSCLATQDRIDAILEILFQETTTLGVRVREMSRYTLPRQSVSVPIHGEMVRIKVADIGAGWGKASPEFDDCKKIAKKTGRPLKTIMEEAMAAYRQGRGKEKPAKMRGRA